MQFLWLPTFAHPCLKTKRICSVLSAVCPIWPPHVWGFMIKLVYNSFFQVLERMANELEHRVVKACSLSPYTGESIAMTYSYVQDTIWSFVIVLGNISWILLLLLYGLEIHIVLMLSYFSTLFIIWTQFRLTRYAAEKKRNIMRLSSGCWFTSLIRPSLWNSLFLLYWHTFDLLGFLLHFQHHQHVFRKLPLSYTFVYSTSWLNLKYESSYVGKQIF